VDPDPDWESGCGSWQAKIVPTKGKKREREEIFLLEEFSVKLEASLFYVVRLAVYEGF
jgi:hypothetical protein